MFISPHIWPGLPKTSGRDTKRSESPNRTSLHDVEDVSFCTVRPRTKNGYGLGTDHFMSKMHTESNLNVTCQMPLARRRRSSSSRSRASSSRFIFSYSSSSFWIRHSKTFCFCRFLLIRMGCEIQVGFAVHFASKWLQPLE